MDVQRVCTKCKTAHSATLEFFPPCKSGKYGLSSWCRRCHYDYVRDWAVRNKERHNRNAKRWRERNPERTQRIEKRRHEKHREKRNDYSRRYVQQHREEHCERARQYRKDNPERVREYGRKADQKRLQDPQYRLSHSISGGIRDALKSGKKGHHWETLVGYTLDDLVEHLESLFQEGMSWKNYGRGEDKWHVDHVKPKSSFSFTSFDDPEFKECWALRNLQPLWEPDNLSKGNRLDYQPQGLKK